MDYPPPPGGKFGGLASHPNSLDPSRMAAAAAAAAPTAAVPATSNSLASVALTKKQSKKKRKDAEAAEAAASSDNRLEIGAGRALFGGFVPSRQAPAASLYDFGTDSVGIGDSGVAALGSIYGSRAGKLGTLDTLDDARVRQYTQEATARAQRLGAEKRSTKITKSKRQG